MSLRDVFDAAKAKVDQTDSAFFAKRVLPLVRKMADRINEDPALGVTVKLGGTDGGFYVRPGSSGYYWAFDFTFHTKPDMAPAGKATLRLAGNVPEFAAGPEGSIDLRDEQSMNAVIESLVRKAALDAAGRESFDAANQALQPPQAAGRLMRPIC